MVDVLTDVVPDWLFPTNLPGWPLAMALSMAVAGLAGAVLAPKVGVSRVKVMLWLAAVLMVPAYTWVVPHASGRLPGVWDFCSLGYLPRPSMLARGFNREVLQNVLLLVPAGAAVALWPQGPRRLTALVVTLAVAPVVESVQLIPALHRGCQFGDVVNNSLGVLVGFAIGAAAESVWRSLQEARTSAAPRASELAPAAEPPSRGVRIRGRDG